MGLRFTVNRRNVRDMPGIFDLLEEREIPRVCFYHLVYAGRGTDLVKDDLSMTRPGRRWISSWTGPGPCTTRARPRKCSPWTTTPTARTCISGFYRENPDRAAKVMELLKMNEGNNSGRGIGCVSWNGEVYADQFWRHKSFGNVRNRPFSADLDPARKTIFCSSSRKKRSMSRAGVPPAGGWTSAAEISGSGPRRFTGDVWAPDPACYLTAEEIARP